MGGVKPIERHANNEPTPPRDVCRRDVFEQGKVFAVERDFAPLKSLPTAECLRIERMSPPRRCILQRQFLPQANNIWSSQSALPKVCPYAISSIQSYALLSVPLTRAGIRFDRPDDEALPEGSAGIGRLEKASEK